MSQFLKKKSLMLFSQSRVFNKFGSSSQFQSNPSFISWPNKYLNRILAQTYCAQMTNINSTEKNIQCDWTYNFFLFSFLRSTGREYALKIIKKSKCRGKVSTKKKSYESKRLFFFKKHFVRDQFGKLLVLVFFLASVRIFLVEAFACPLETPGLSV